MRSATEEDLDVGAELHRLLFEFGISLAPEARPKLIAFLHLLSDGRSVEADFGVAEDGRLMLVLTGEGEARPTGDDHPE
jgi:hypothetical protein